MPETILPPAQSKPAATTLTDAFTVAADTSVVVSTVTITNTGATSDFAWVSVAVNGAVDDLKQYRIVQLLVPPKNPFMATVGWCLNEGDVVRVKSTNGNLAFNFERLEIT